MAPHLTQIIINQKDESCTFHVCGVGVWRVPNKGAARTVHTPVRVLETGEGQTKALMPGFFDAQSKMCWTLLCADFRLFQLTIPLTSGFPQNSEHKGKNGECWTPVRLTEVLSHHDLLREIAKLKAKPCVTVTFFFLSLLLSTSKIALKIYHRISCHDPKTPRWF